jgi:uncharacterized protein YwgA
MNQLDEVRVENGTDLILALLYAGGTKKEKGEEVVGNTRLDKLVFLLEQETSLRKYLADFKFDAYNYGPYSSEVFDAIQALISAGLVKAEQLESEGYLDEADRFQIEDQASDSGPGPKTTIVYGLTAEGEIVGSALFNSLSLHEREELVALKKSFNSISLRKLLQYVYRKYPSSTTESVIREYVY